MVFFSQIIFQLEFSADIANVIIKYLPILLFDYLFFFLSFSQSGSKNLSTVIIEQTVLHIPRTNTEVGDINLSWQADNHIMVADDDPGPTSINHSGKESLFVFTTVALILYAWVLILRTHIQLEWYILRWDAYSTTEKFRFFRREFLIGHGQDRRCNPTIFNFPFVGDL